MPLGETEASHYERGADLIVGEDAGGPLVLIRSFEIKRVDQ